LYSPKSQIVLRRHYNLYAYDSTVPGPHNRSGKTEKKLSRGKREETLRRATEEDPSPRMGRSNRCHVYRMNSVTVTTYSINIFDYYYEPVTVNVHSTNYNLPVDHLKAFFFILPDISLCAH